MSISFTGLASGLDTNSIIEQLMAIESRPMQLSQQKVETLENSKTYIDNIETRIKTLKTSLQKLTDGNIAASMDLFKTKEATSSDESKVTVTAGPEAVNQSFNVNVITIATSTKASSLGASPTGNVGSNITGATLATDLTNGTGTTGNFTVYYNGVASQIAVNAGDDVNAVLARISAVGGGGQITASVAGGVVTLASTGGGTITAGANGDTSNFLQATQLDIGVYTGNDLISANANSQIKTSGTLVGNAARLQTAVTAGTTTIGGKQFTINASTTLDSLISQINNDADADVTASYNVRTNKIDLVSKEPGKTAITLGAAGDTSNFLQAINVVAVGDSLAYQNLGTNATFQINGGTIVESTSNTVSDSVTGLKNVTLNLKAPSSGTNVNVNISQDTETLTDAIDKIVTDFNNAISYIDTQTNIKTGNLPGDSSLNRLRTSLRTEITNLVANSPLMSLATVGITTGSVGTTGDPTSKITFDKTKFIEALQETPEDVRDLFLGNTSKSITGVMQKLQTYLDSSLDPENGLFASRDAALDKQIEDLNKSIAKAQERLTSKESQLKAQFSAMEQAISKLNSQSSSLTSQS